MRIYNGTTRLVEVSDETDLDKSELITLELDFLSNFNGFAPAALQYNKIHPYSKLRQPVDILKEQ